MKKIFLFSLVLVLLFANVNAKIYKIEASGNDQQMEVTDVYVQPGQETSRNLQQSAFSATFFDFNGNRINPLYPFPNLFGRNVFAETFLFLLSYQPSAEFVAIENLQGEFLGIKHIGYLSESCGDGFCAIHESEGDCPTDCNIGQDDYCSNAQTNDGVCDTDCLALASSQEPFSLDPDCTPPQLECTEASVCYLNAVFTCVRDRNAQSHWFKIDVCQQGETCTNGYCDNGLQELDVFCETNDDCIVNGDAQHWFCNCRNKCQKTFNNNYGQQCCNGRLNG